MNPVWWIIWFFFFLRSRKISYPFFPFPSHTLLLSSFEEGSMWEVMGTHTGGTSQRCLCKLQQQCWLLQGGSCICSAVCGQEKGMIVFRAPPKITASLKRSALTSSDSAILFSFSYIKISGTWFTPHTVIFLWLYKFHYIFTKVK